MPANIVWLVVGVLVLIGVVL
ncbi:MAG: hypothetical protein JWO69_1867, partial [Thermoleophilia bacterium]|nr:hypothetical protein [Thermoleophilia bacterium]